tara:strand:- start:152 stop:277 length:126 start_codon:yes stop_codon:yes gene_type:complete
MRYLDLQKQKASATLTNKKFYIFLDNLGFFKGLSFAGYSFN